MRFRFYGFACETDVYTNGEDLLVRFYDKGKENDEANIPQLTNHDAGYGYMCLRVRGNAGFICGWVDESIFTTDEMIEEAVEFVVNHSSDPVNINKSYHIHRMKPTHYIKYICRQQR